MGVECIHGLDEALCDLCSPKPILVEEAAAPRASRPRSTPRRVAGAAPAAARVVAVGEQRVFHVTHVRNLPQILSTGALLADASDAWTERPAVDISSALTRELRRDTEAAEGSHVSEYVTFSLTPNAGFWVGIREDQMDPRLSTDARHMPATDFVMLVSTVAKAAVEGTIITNGDASDERTNFSQSPESGERQLRRLQAEESQLSILQAEFLVPESFPLESVTLIGVANDKVRATVKAALKTAGNATKVVVYPPWFQRADA